MRNITIITFVVFILTILAFVDIPKKHAFAESSNGATELLNKLFSKNESEVEEARQSIDDFEFQRSDLPIIYSTIKNLPDNSDSLGSIKEILFRKLWEVSDDSTLKFIEEVYPTLPENSDLKYLPLQNLLFFDNEKSQSFFTELLVTDAPEIDPFYINRLFETIGYILERRPEYKNIYFPKLLQLLNNDHYKDELYSSIATMLSQQSLLYTDLSEYQQIITTDLVNKYSETEKISDDAEALEVIVLDLEILLDIAGYLPGSSEALSIVEKGLDNSSPRIRLWSALSSTRLGIIPDSKVYIEIAKHDELRSDLYYYLNKMKKTELFPSEYLSQESFARADLAQWLSYPTEFGMPPEKMELLDTKELVDEKGLSGRVYLFKYYYSDDYYDGEANEGWLVGLSGMQPIRKEEYFPYGFYLDEDGTNHSLTFSHFNKLESKSIEEHYMSFLDK